jgi:hypothetical protein
MPGPEIGLIAEGAHQRIPEPPVIDGSFECEVERCFCRPGDIFRPLNLAVHPVNAIGHAGEHEAPFRSCRRPPEDDPFLVSPQKTV